MLAGLIVISNPLQRCEPAIALEDEMKPLAILALLVSSNDEPLDSEEPVAYDRRLQLNEAFATDALCCAFLDASLRETLIIREDKVVRILEPEVVRIEKKTVDRHVFFVVLDAQRFSQVLGSQGECQTTGRREAGRLGPRRRLAYVYH